MAGYRLPQRSAGGHGDVGAKSQSDDSGPLSLATALLLERIYLALDYLVVGPLL